MWTKSPPRDSGSVPNSASPFFPDVSPNAARNKRNAAASMQQQQHSQQAEEKEQQHPGTTQQAPRTLGSSASAHTLPLSPAAATAAAPSRYASLHSSASAASLSTASPYNTGARLNGPFDANALPPSNASSKLARRSDRFQSVEELLQHSQAVIAAGGRLPGSQHLPLETTASTAQMLQDDSGGYSPTLFSTWGGSEPPSLVPGPAKVTASTLARKVLEKNAARNAAIQANRSPFATIAPPPLPAPPAASWAGLNPAPTPGLVHYTASPAFHGATSPLAKMVARVDAKLAKLAREETKITVHPSVLFSAGMDGQALQDDFEATTEFGATGTMRAASPTKSHSGSGSGGRGSGLVPKDVGSKSVAERLWIQHQHMMRQARSVLPMSLRRGTQRQVIEAVQRLKPKVLLDVFSPQLHVLSVTMAELTKLVRTDDKEKALLLRHIAQHQALITDILVQFANVSVPTLQSDATTSGGSGFADTLAAGEEDEDEEDDLKLMAEAVKLESMSQDPSSLAALMFRSENLSSPLRQSMAASGHFSQAASPLRSPASAKAQNGGGNTMESQFDAATGHAYADLGLGLGGGDYQQHQQQDERDRSFSPIREDGTGFTSHFRHPSGAFSLHQIMESSLDESAASPFQPPSKPSVFPSPLSALDTGTGAASSSDKGSHRAQSHGQSQSQASASAAGAISFGNSHSWELERWRQNLLSVRASELAQEQKYLHAIELVSALSMLRSRSIDELGSSEAKPDPSSYSTVHGHTENARSALQARLDKIKTELEPAYAALFIRHHEMILSVEEVEAAAREEELRKEAAAASASASSDSSPSKTSNASVLAMQLAMLRQSERAHSTFQSAYTSSGKSGASRPHRLPHSTWLSISTPSSDLLQLASADSGAASAGMRGMGSAGVASAAALRSSRIRSLVALENVMSASHERQAALLDAHRSLQSRFQALESWQAASIKAQEESTAMHAAQLTDLESKLKIERSRCVSLEKDLSLARYELVNKDTKIESLYTQLAELSYTVKQLQTTYTHHALFKRAALDSSAGQTDGAITGLECGGFNAEGIVIPRKSRWELAVEAGGTGFNEEDAALLAAANLTTAPPQIQVAALAAAAALAEATKSGRIMLQQQQQPQPQPAGGNTGGAQAQATRKQTALSSASNSTTGSGGPASAGGANRGSFISNAPSMAGVAASAVAASAASASAAGAAAGASHRKASSSVSSSSSARSGAPSPVHSNGPSRRGSNDMAMPAPLVSTAANANNSTASGPSRRTMSLSSAESTAAAVAAAASSEKKPSSRAITDRADRESHREMNLPSLAEGSEL